MNSRSNQWLLAASAAFLALGAHSAQAEDEKYQGLSAGIFLPDSARDDDAGFTIEGFLGYPTSPITALELGGFGSRSKQDEGDADTFLGARLSMNLGRRDPGSVFALVGFGGIQQQTFYGNELAPFVHAGVGFYPPSSNLREKMRVELRWQGVITDVVPDETMLNDLRLTVGFMVGGSAKPVAAVPVQVVAAAAPAPASEPTPAPAAVGALDRLWEYNLYFERSSHILSESEMDVAKELAAVLLANPDMYYELSGFADPTGPKALNAKLSLRRAKFVRDYLFMMGVDAAQLRYKGRGVAASADFPQTPRADDDNARLRRVETQVLK